MQEDNTKTASVSQSDEMSGYTLCPNCQTLTKEEDFDASFKYATLIKCPSCEKKVKPNNSAKISDVPYF